MPDVGDGGGEGAVRGLPALVDLTACSDPRRQAPAGQCLFRTTFRPTSRGAGPDVAELLEIACVKLDDCRHERSEPAFVTRATGPFVPLSLPEE